jgi:hypothetical protein
VRNYLFGVVASSAGSEEQPLGWVFKLDLADQTDVFHDVYIDSNNNLYAAGYYFNGSNHRGILLKMDLEANVVWQRAIAGGTFDYYNSIGVDSSGNIYGVGQSTIDNQTDVFVVKYDAATGNKTWDIRYFNTNRTNDARGSFVGSDGTVYIGGTNGDGNVGGDIHFGVISSSGSVLMQKRMNRATYDYGTDAVAVGAWGDPAWRGFVSGYFFLGNFQSHDAYIACFLPDGTLSWQRIIGAADEWPCNLALGDSNSVYLVFRSNQPGTNQPFVYKYAQSDGALLWSTRIVSSNVSYLQNIATDSSNDLYILLDVTINAKAGIGIVKMSSAGSIVWQRYLYSADDDYATAITFDTVGNMYLSMRTQNNAQTDAYIIKLPSDGSGVGFLNLFDKTFTYEASDYTLASSTLSVATTGFTVSNETFSTTANYYSSTATSLSPIKALI